MRDHASITQRVRRLICCVRMNKPIQATAPDRHASVHASAGTGKTWLLVTRMLRLLLAGAAPENILAVTFTRRAAAEMLQRLNERLAHLASGSEAEVDAALREMDETPDDACRERARRLYENLLFAPHALRATTFHAFCQEILQRFPVEAEIPPGFELLEAESELIEQAWDALYAEATLKPDGKIASALETLFDGCNGLDNTRRAVNSFLQQRIDWWAYTAGYADNLAPAEARSHALFGIAPDCDPAAKFFDAARTARLSEFAALLGKHVNKTNLGHQANLLAGLETTAAVEERLQQVSRALLTTAGEARVRKPSKALDAALGGAGAARFLELHVTLCNEVQDTHDQRARIAALALNLAWHHAGQRLLEHYQRIKREQRVLDFSDLEWHAYRLLNGSQQAHWVQYKLDAHIDHFLIDEFQDTNPTQWRLLLPLFEELAASAAERPRSVFLVGDAKQSIYRFRRADARLLTAASSYLGARLNAERFSLEASWRSAPAIIDAVNWAFSAGPLAEILADFPVHSTQHEKLWGRVELLPPLAEPEPPTAAPLRVGLRNPLLEPRPQPADDLHAGEALRIAQRIRELIGAGTLVGAANDARPLRYGDIFILLRTRTHASTYEVALRHAGIPYLGAARGTLLDSLEVRDLEALLNTLITPYNNLALAQVLRSPLFAARDEDLITLAQATGTTWMERLLVCGPLHASDAPLARAARLLPMWQTWVGQLPVHDLLDRIYHQGDILKRFEAAATSELRPRVRANLIRFIELALDIDSGRYPSLPHFLTRLNDLRQRATDAPDDAPPESGAGDRVRFLTVHGAKGLEAPVVFLADSASKPRDRSTWQALTDWPAEQDRPETFLLVGRKDSRDRISTALLERQQQAERREDANLLYVALTRARQMLIVSAAVTPGQAEQGWYGLLRAQWDTDNQLATGTAWVHQSGNAPTITVAPVENVTPRPPPAAAIDPRLNLPLPPTPQLIRIAPSRSLVEHDAVFEGGNITDPDGRRRGIGIHRLLEWLTTPSARTRAQLLAGLVRELHRDAGDPELAEWLQEAEAVIQAPQFAQVFDTAAHETVYTEVPLQYFQGEALVDGIIDRLLLGADSVHIIDYKTHGIEAAQAEATAQTYREQLRLYADGVRKLWPHRRVRASILFTHCRVLVDVAV